MALSRASVVLGWVACASAAIGLAACASLGTSATSGTTGESPQAGSVSRESRKTGSPYAYEWFVRAELRRARNELTPAIEAYRLALASSDEDPYVLTRLATALDASGERAPAEAALASAFAQDPYSEVAWLARAEIAERHGESAQAFEAYERAESAAPSSAKAPLALAALLQKQGLPERARAVLLRYEARVLPAQPGAGRARLSRALLSQDADAAFAAARAQLGSRIPDVEAILYAARLLVEQGRCALALTLFEGLSAQPDQAALRLRAHLACGELAAAELLLRSSDPELFGGWLEVSRAYLVMGRGAEALELASGYRALHPDDLAAMLVVAEAKLATGAYAEAADLFARVPAAARGAEEARRGLAQALEAEGLPELAAEVLRARGMVQAAPAQ